MKIKERLFKLIIAVLIFSLPNIGVSGAYFTDQAAITGNAVSTGCWAKPTTPQLIYPENNYFAAPGSEWLNNPFMDWSDATTTCPGGVITYQYESYRDSSLTSLAYRSGVLTSSMIPAPGTPDGTYYWRVRSYDGTNWSDWSDVWLLIVNRSVPATTQGFSNSTIGPPATSSTPGDVVINEILPNPNEDDNALMPAGEWVELYNRSDSDVDVSGWVLYDAEDVHKLIISSSNSDNNGDTADSGETVVPAHGFLVVYRNGDGDFSLDNDGDTVRLYNAEIGSGGTMVDSYTYSGIIPDNKSIARYPDGGETWYDPIPTPGRPNQLEDEGPVVNEDLNTTTEDSQGPEVPAEDQFVEIEEDTEPQLPSGEQETKVVTGEIKQENEDSIEENSSQPQADNNE